MSNNNGFSSYSSFVPQVSDEAPSHQSSVRVHDAINRVDLNADNITESARVNARVTTSDLHEFKASGDFRATARNSNGTPVTAILGTTLVEIGGMQAPVSTFVAAGLLQSNPDGTFTEATQAPADQDDSQSNPGGADVFPLDTARMDAVNQALDTVPQASLDSLIAAAAGAAAGRLTPAQLAHKFSQVSGLDPAEGAAKLAVIQGAFMAQTSQALQTRGGIAEADHGAFFDWAKTNQQGALMEALHKQMHGHDVSGFTALAKQWMAATPPSVNALKAAGIPVRAQGQGQEVFLKGSWMSLGAAARAGLI